MHMTANTRIVLGAKSAALRGLVCDLLVKALARVEVSIPA
jgi:hypothetical protein